MDRPTLNYVNYLKSREIACLLRVGPSTVHRMIAAGIFADAVKIGRNFRIPLESVLRYINAPFEPGPRQFTLTVKYLTIGEAAEICRVNTATVRRLISGGAFPGTLIVRSDPEGKGGGGRTRIPERSLSDFLKSQHVV